MEPQTDLLQDDIFNPSKRRRTLLPWWIKIFIWMFLVFGAIVPLCLILGITGSKFQITLYGLATNEPLSATGLFLTFLFLFKGVVAYGLWSEKEWAINLGLIDAAVGIVICVFMMFIYPLIDNEPQFIFHFRVELLVLVPYLLQMKKTAKMWALYS